MSNVSRRMPLLSIPAALGMAAVAVCGWSIVHTTKQRGALSKLRSAALAQFRQAHTASQDNRLQFNGESAQIVLQEEVGGVSGILARSPNYILTIYARNEHGEYFMFKSSPNKPLLKHVPAEVARAVLKELYVPAS